MLIHQSQPAWPLFRVCFFFVCFLLYDYLGASLLEKAHRAPISIDVRRHVHIF